MLGFLYEIGYMKNGSNLFKIWCWLSYRRWYHILNIPGHILKGFFYGYNFVEIIQFCIGIIKGEFNTKALEKYKTREIISK